MRRGLGLGTVTLADAITRQENTPSYLNNPGALTAAPSRYCQLGKQGILVQFCTPADGQAALDNQIQLNVNRGWTLSDFFNSYAPAASGNNPTVYTQNVAEWTGIDPSIPLSNYDPGMLLAGMGTGTGSYSTVDATSGISDTVASLLGGDSSNVDWVMVGVGLLALYVVTQTIF